MFLATHAVTGALIAKVAPNPVVAFALGFVSHFVLDMVPHGDAEMYKKYQNGERMGQSMAKVMIDGVVTLYLVLAMREANLFDHEHRVSAAIAGSVLPDLIVGFYLGTKTKYLKWFHDFHIRIHNVIVNRYRDVSFMTGLVMQIILLIILQTKLAF